VLELVNLSKSYAGGQVKAVDNVSLKVRQGEIFGFLGPNGAGKTTTIKMIVGLLQPDEGTILIDGINSEKDPLAAKRKIGQNKAGRAAFRNPDQSRQPFSGVVPAGMEVVHQNARLRNERNSCRYLSGVFCLFRLLCSARRTVSGRDQEISRRLPLR